MSESFIYGIADLARFGKEGIKCVCHNRLVYYDFFVMYNGFRESVLFMCFRQNIIYNFPCFFYIIFEFVKTRFIMQLFGCTYTFLRMLLYVVIPVRIAKCSGESG